MDFSLTFLKYMVWRYDNAICKTPNNFRDKIKYIRLFLQGTIYPPYDKQVANGGKKISKLISLQRPEII